MTAPLLANRVAEIWTGTGTGTIAPGGALTGGYRAWEDAFAVGDEVRYVIAHRSALEYEIGIGTIGAGSTLSRDTIVESSNADALVSFSAGEKDVFCALDAVTLMGIGIQRLDVQVVTTLLAIGDVYEAAVTDFGRFFRLLKFTAQADRGAWIRLYGSAADRTADVRTDPTVAVTTEAVLAEAVLYDTDLVAEAPAGVHGIGVFLDNTESPQLGRLFVRITRLDETGGTTPPTTLFGDDLANPSPGSGDVDLDSRSPSDPDDPAFDWEYEGVSDDWQVWSFGGAFKNGSSSVARTDIDILGDDFELRFSLFILAVPTSCTAEVLFNVPDTALGSWNGRDYLVVRASAPDLGVALLYIDGSGVTNTLATDTLTGWGPSAVRYFRLRRQGGTVTVWVATQSDRSDETVLFDAITVPDLTAQARIALDTTGFMGSGGMVPSDVFWQDLADPAAVDTLTLAVLGDRLAA
jgi:hypothetical protein